MFAEQFTALVDACSLARTLPRNLLLPLAEAEFFRLRWAIEAILIGRDIEDAARKAGRNLKNFPADKLAPLNLEARSADAFLADTINLDPGQAVAAIRRMRKRFKRPEKTAEQLLLKMKAEGLVETVLRKHVLSL